MTSAARKQDLAFRSAILQKTPEVAACLSGRLRALRNRPTSQSCRSRLAPEPWHLKTFRSAGPRTTAASFSFLPPLLSRLPKAASARRSALRTVPLRLDDDTPDSLSVRLERRLW